LSDLGLDCRECTKQDKIERGCDRDSPITDVWKVGKYTLSRCPKRVIRPQAYKFIRAFNFLNRPGGGWPNPGTWMAQPVKLIEAMEYIHQDLESQAEEDAANAKKS
jgi:hypothetical protein